MAFKKKENKDDKDKDKDKGKEPEDKEQPKSIKDLMDACNKRFGDNSLIKMSDTPQVCSDPIKTGALQLDDALGIGGLPRGRMIEIYGPTGGGKSSMALSIAAEVQRGGGVVAFIDAEQTLDTVYAAACGLNVDDLIINQPDYGEQAIDIIEMIIDSELADLVIVDSVAALTPKAELENDMEKQDMCLQSRMLGKACRRLTSRIAQTRTTLIWINQLREKPGVMYGSPEYTPGGKAIPFYCSVRIDIRKMEAIKKGNEEIGNHVKAKIVKNKVGIPHKVAEFDIIFGKGIDRNRSLIQFATDNEVITKAGSWYSYGADRIGQGFDAAVAHLEANPVMFETIKKQVEGLRK